MARKKKQEAETEELDHVEGEVEETQEAAPAENPEGAVADFVPDTQPMVVVDKEPEVDSEFVRKRVIELRDTIGESSFELCKHIYTIQHKNLYKSWGHNTFREYVSKELEFKSSKAYHLSSTYKNVCVGQGKEVFDKIAPLGWSKFSKLARIVTRENVGEWVDKAKHLSVDAIDKEVRKEVSTKQGTTPTEALENEAEVRGTPVEDQKKTISIQFEYNDYLALMQVSELIQTEMPGTPIGAVVGMACADFLGSQPEEKGWGFALSIMKRLSSFHNKAIVVIDKESKSVDYGFDELKNFVGATTDVEADPEPGNAESEIITEDELEDISGVFNG